MIQKKNLTSVDDDDWVRLTPEALSFNKVKRATLQVIVTDTKGVLSPGVPVTVAVLTEPTPFQNVDCNRIAPPEPTGVHPVASGEVKGLTDRNGSITFSFALAEEVYHSTQMMNAVVQITVPVPRVGTSPQQFVMDTKTITALIVPVGPDDPSEVIEDEDA
jgi:hypothetical protein